MQVKLEQLESLIIGKVAEAANQLQLPAFVVGGFVRDKLLGRPCKDIDVVCVMSVNPGFGGQKFIEHTYDKVRALKQIIVDAGATTLIEIDGGVTEHNASALVKAGADVLVAGTTVFKAADPKAMIVTLLNAS